MHTDNKHYRFWPAVSRCLNEKRACCSASLPVMATNMPNAQYAVTGFSTEYDWRPIEFEEPVDPAKICASCKVISRGTALLGCSHALCEPCFMMTLRKDQRCPVEDAAYTEGEVEWLSTSVAELEDMVVKCWNARHGCPHRGTLRELPSHFYSKCPYQTVTCDRCRKEVLRSDMADHRDACPPREVTAEAGEAETATSADNSGKVSALSLAEVVDFQYNLETKLNSLVEHIHQKDGAGASKPELLTAAIGLLRTIGLLSLTTTWRPHGLAVVVSRVRYFAKQVPEYAEEVYSAPSDVCGYSLRLGVRCERKLASSPTASSSSNKDGEDLLLRFKAQLCPGVKNSALQWPFRKSLTLSIVHPNDSTKEVRFFLNTSMMAGEPAFQMPGCEDNPPFSIGGPLHVAALAGCQFWSYGTLQLRLGMALTSGERDAGN